MTTHPSGITPVEYNVLIRPRPVEERTAGGLILPEDTREKEKYAKEEGWLEAVSIHAFDYAEWPEGTKPRVGDYVVFGKYAGTSVMGNDDVEYRLVKDKDVAAIMEK